MTLAEEVADHLIGSASGLVRCGFFTVHVAINVYTVEFELQIVYTNFLVDKHVAVVFVATRVESGKVNSRLEVAHRLVPALARVLSRCYRRNVEYLTQLCVVLVSTHIDGFAYKSALVSKLHFDDGDCRVSILYSLIVIAKHLLLIVGIRTSIEQEERRTQRIVLGCGVGEVRSVHGIGISRTVDNSTRHLAIIVMIGKRLVVACQCSAFYASNVRFEHSAWGINAASLYLGSSVGKLRQVGLVVLVLP